MSRHHETPIHETPQETQKETAMIEKLRTRVRCEARGIVADDRGDVPGWVLVTLVSVT